MTSVELSQLLPEQLLLALQRVQHYFCSFQTFETVLGFKIHIKARFDSQIQPSHLCSRVGYSPCAGKWRLNLNLAMSPNFGAASSPYGCATSAEQGKAKWTKLKSVTSRISSALTPMPWQRQKRKDLQIPIQNWILTTTIFFFSVIILKCCSISYMQHYTKKSY